MALYESKINYGYLGIVRMIEAAKEGDLNAAKLILSYAIGRSDNPINPYRVDT